MDDAILVFVVEDEPLIQDLLGCVLEDAGFQVATAANGEEAIVKLEAQAPVFRSLLTDVNLRPGKLTGWDVARRARELNPDLAVVYMTGDSADEWRAKGVPNSVLVTKPFAPAQVVTALSQLLKVGG